MDYFEIGQKIRKFRKAHGFSQEELAERVGISTTHLSHIETGNTKLSLPVLVDLALTLEVSTDALLFNRAENQRSIALNEMAEVLERCDTRQTQIISDIVKATKITLDKHDRRL